MRDPLPQRAGAVKGFCRGRDLSESVTIAGGIKVRLRRSDRARRITLRVARHDGGVTLTLPRHAPLNDGVAFAESRAGWLRRQLDTLTLPIAVAHGAMLPVEGRLLCVTPAATRSARIEDDLLLVPQNRAPGPPIAALLKQLALARLTEASDRYSRRLGRRYSSIALRDTRSRWGSCTADGRLMYSWRLVMAPHEVLDYVAAHEVAHLRRMDHSPAFWAQVARLCPDHVRLRDWLRRNGDELLAFRFTVD